MRPPPPLSSVGSGLPRRIFDNSQLARVSPMRGMLQGMKGRDSDLKLGEPRARALNRSCRPPSLISASYTRILSAQRQLVSCEDRRLRLCRAACFNLLHGGVTYKEKQFMRCARA